MDSVLRGLSCLSVPFTLFIFIMMALVMKKGLPSKKSMYISGIVFSGLMLLINATLFSSGTNFLCFIPYLLILVGGFILGSRSGKKSEMIMQEGKVMVKRSVFPIIIWAVGYFLTQFFSAFLPAILASVGVILMFFSTGATIGMNRSLLNRHNELLMLSSTN